MKTRHVVLLGAVFAGLVALFVMTEGRERRQQRTAAQAMPVFAFEPDDIATLLIEQQGAPPVEAVREDDGRWSIVAPYRHIRANQSRWNQIAETLATMVNQRTIEQDIVDREAFGLDAPRLSVLVGHADGHVWSLRFGALDPTQVNRYAQVDEGEVFLVRANTFGALNHGLLHLRDRGMFTHLSEGISRIDYERFATDADSLAEADDDAVVAAGTEIDEAYAIQDNGTWRVVEPEDAYANQDRAALLAQNLRLLSAREYIDDPESLADFGLDPPFARLTAYAPDGTKQTLLLGWIADDPENAGIFVKRTDNPSVLVVDAHLISLLPSEPGGFREKRLFTREAKNLDTITYTDPSNRIVLQIDPDAGWTMIEPAAPTTDQVAVSMYVAMLKRIEGVRFPDESEVERAFGSPRAQLEFTYTDDSPPSSIVVGAPVPDSDPLRLYARQDFGSVTEISFGDFQAIKAVPFDFRVKTIFPFRPEWITSFELSIGGTQYAFRRVDNRWLLTAPEHYRLQAQSDVTSLLRAFNEATATDIAATAPVDEVTGFDDPVLSVRFTLDTDLVGDNQMGRVDVGNRRTERSRQRFLRIEGSDEVFFVDQRLIDRVREALRGVVPQG